MGLVPFKEEFSLPCGATERRLLSASQEADACQDLNLPAPDLGLLRLLSWEKSISIGKSLPVLGIWLWQP